MWCIAIVQSTPLHETTTLVALSTGLRSNCVRCKDAQMKTLGGVCIKHTGTEKKNKIKKLREQNLRTAHRQLFSTNDNMAFHTRKTLPIPLSSSSQNAYFNAAAAAKLRSQSYVSNQKKQLHTQQRHRQQLLQQRNQQRLHKDITMPKDPVTLAAKRAAKANASKTKLKQKQRGRGARWYDNSENLIQNGAELADARAKRYQLNIVQEKKEKEQTDRDIASKKRANVEAVLMEAKQRVNVSGEFEKGSFRLLRQGSLYRQERKRVLQITFGTDVDMNDDLHDVCWNPGVYKQSVLCTRGTKHYPRHLNTNASVDRPRPVGYGGSVRVFSSLG